MLNHTYTSVKNANLVDCGKKQHIPSQPSPLLKDNFLGEFRTELDKKKVLANLGIATSLSLEWEYIKGDIGRSKALMQELDSRTKYISAIDGFQKSLLEGIQYLETVIGGEQDAEHEQDRRLEALETLTSETVVDLEEFKGYIAEGVELDIDKLQEDLATITAKVDNITDLIQVSTKEGNALVLLGSDDVEEGQIPGLYVPDLSETLNGAVEDITELQETVETIQESLDDFVTKDALGGGGTFNFVDQGEFDDYADKTDDEISDIKIELGKTVKTGEDGHVDTLFVNKISKNNDDGNIVITDSFEVESGIPLDVRCVVNTIDDLLAIPVKVCYPGMGVIVNSISSLYILRDPSGKPLTQNYIGDIDNWKCPEDLVTVALTKQEYEQLPEKSNHIFYYIYEEPVIRDTEPKREDFNTIEEYEQALLEWVNSVKILADEYMSAAWGVQIEELVSNKVNKDELNTLYTNVNNLKERVNAISGGDNENSLGSLSERVSETETDLRFLLGTEGTDQEPNSKGKIYEIEESITTLDSKLSDEYVTKESITTDSDDTVYIFVKKSEYEEYMRIRDEAASKAINTESLTTNSVVTEEVFLSNTSITSNGSDLFVNNEEVALLEDVPKFIYLTQTRYDELVGTSEFDPNAYYCTTSEETYVTKTEFNTRISQLDTALTLINNAINALQNRVTQLEAQITTLVSTSSSQTNA